MRLALGPAGYGMTTLLMAVRIVGREEPRRAMFCFISRGWPLESSARWNSRARILADPFYSVVDELRLTTDLLSSRPPLIS